MRKVFISPETVRDDAFRLAMRMYLEGVFPNVLYIALRGGSVMGLPISEFFKQMQKRDPARRRVMFAAVTARSYTGMAESEEDVRVEGWTYNPEHLRADDQVMLVDDVFDKGRTINHLVRLIVAQGIPRAQIKVVVHDYKLRTFLPKHLPVQPDYWCERHVIEREEDDPWLHYGSHELEGLTEEEMRRIFPNAPDLVSTLPRG